MTAAARINDIHVKMGCEVITALRCMYCGESEAVRPVTRRIGQCRACRSLSPIPRDKIPPAPQEDMDHAPPFAIGDVVRERYRLKELLGSGAHGLTYLAHHEFLNHPCVVKILPSPVESSSESAVRRLRLEASAGFRVNHENVVRVLDGDVVDGVCYFAMEYVDGADLAEATKVDVLMDWRQAVRTAIDTARGLDAIHAAGLVHHDVKPGNLLLGTDGRVRVADLGVVNLISPEPGLTADETNGIDGTLGYAAPEVFAREADIGPAADLYSLGATLFELVTGRLPRGESVYETVLASDKRRIEWPENSQDAAPRWFVDGILRLLDADPAERFASAAELVAYLEHPTEAAPSKPPRPPTEHPEPRGLVVTPFENSSGDSSDDWLGHALADHLARSLARLPDAYVVDTDQFQQTLERIERRGGASHAQQVAGAARISGAANIVVGAFSRSGHKIEIAASVKHAASGSSQALESVHGPLSGLGDLENELLTRIAETLGLATAETPAARATGDRVLAADERFFTAKRAFLDGDYETAVRLGEEAIELDDRNGDMIGFVGACCARMGRYAEAVDFNRRLEELAEHENDERIRAQARANLGAMHYFRGDYDSARTCLIEAVGAAERLGLTTENAQIRNNLGFVLLQLGRQQEAEATFQHAVAALKRYGALVALVGPYNGLGHVCREQKRYDEAREYFRRALSLAQESDDNVNTGVAFMNLGQCAMLQGRLADAKHELAVALNILEKTSFWNGLARVYEYMAEMNLRLSNWREAVRCADQRIKLAQRHSNGPMETAAKQQRDQALAVADGDGDAGLDSPNVDAGKDRVA